jgi:hypothetical protein
MHPFGCNRHGWDHPRLGNIRPNCGIEWSGEIGRTTPSLFFLIVGSIANPSVPPDHRTPPPEQLRPEVRPKPRWLSSTALFSGASSAWSPPPQVGAPCSQPASCRRSLLPASSPASTSSHKHIATARLDRWHLWHWEPGSTASSFVTDVVQRCQHPRHRWWGRLVQRASSLAAGLGEGRWAKSATGEDEQYCDSQQGEDGSYIISPLVKLILV